MEENKVQLKVYISHKLDEKFRKMVAMKYVRIERGLLSHEVEQALQQYMASSNTQAQSTQTRSFQQKFEKNNPIPSVYTLKHEIRKYLFESGKYDDEYTQFIPHKHLVEAINALKGVDKRTVDKWINLLKRYDCIRQAGEFRWEIT